MDCQLTTPLLTPACICNLMTLHTLHYLAPTLIAWLHLRCQSARDALMLQSDQHFSNRVALFLSV